MILGDQVWTGFGGFAIGAAYVWIRGGRVRDELLRTRFDAEHDCLTRLPNRAGLQRRYESGGSGSRSFTMALLDLDGFKKVNDDHGHEVGDLFLENVASRLNGACPAQGLVGRLGGDEFLILIRDSRPAEAAVLVHGMLRHLAEPITVSAGVALSPKASVGIAPGSPEGTWSAQLRCADIALYQAKNGPERVVQFQQGMRHPNRQPASGPSRRPQGRFVNPVPE